MGDALLDGRRRDDDATEDAKDDAKEAAEAVEASESDDRASDRDMRSLLLYISDDSSVSTRPSFVQKRVCMSFIQWLVYREI